MSFLPPFTKNGFGSMWSHSGWLPKWSSAMTLGLPLWNYSTHQNTFLCVFHFLLTSFWGFYPLWPQKLTAHNNNGTIHNWSQQVYTMISWQLPSLGSKCRTSNICNSVIWQAIGINTTKSPTSGAGIVSETRLMSSQECVHISVCFCSWSGGGASMCLFTYYLQSHNW